MGAVDGIGMMICNGRRWPRAWRILGPRSMELMVLGYNTPSLKQEVCGFQAHDLRVFHPHLSIHAGCYRDAAFAGASAKAGTEDECELFGIIVNPLGEIVTQAAAWDFELIKAPANCDSALRARRRFSPATSIVAPRHTHVSPIRPARPIRRFGAHNFVIRAQD